MLSYHPAVDPETVWYKLKVVRHLSPVSIKCFIIGILLKAIHFYIEAAPWWNRQPNLITFDINCVKPFSSLHFVPSKWPCVPSPIHGKHPPLICCIAMWRHRYDCRLCAFRNIYSYSIEWKIPTTNTQKFRLEHLIFAIPIIISLTIP